MSNLLASSISLDFSRNVELLSVSKAGNGEDGAVKIKLWFFLSECGCNGL